MPVQVAGGRGFVIVLDQRVDVAVAAALGGDNEPNRLPGFDPDLFKIEDLGGVPDVENRMGKGRFAAVLVGAVGVVNQEKIAGGNLFVLGAGLDEIGNRLACPGRIGDAIVDVLGFLRA